MSVDLTTPGNPDHRRIEPDQIEAWATWLRTTPQHVCEAINAVGNRVSDVEAHVQQHPHYGRSGHGAASLIPHMDKQTRSSVSPPALPDPPAQPCVDD